MPNSQALPPEVKPATRNYFRITIQWQKKKKENTAPFLGTKMLRPGWAWCSNLLGKRQGLLWSPVQLEPAVCACLKSFSLEEMLGFFFFLIYTAFSFSWHYKWSCSSLSAVLAPSKKIWHWEIGPTFFFFFFFQVINGNTYLLQPSNLHRRHCQNALNFFWKQQMTTAG